MFDLIDGCMISWRVHGVCGAGILFGAITLDKLFVMAACTPRLGGMRGRQ